MKRIETQTNINQLLHDLPESTQQVIRGGIDGSGIFVGSLLSSNVASTSGGPYSTGYVKVSGDG